MKIILPPPFVFLICAGGMYFLPPLGRFHTSIFFIFTIILLASLISIFSLWQFYQAKTTISPLAVEKTSYLITKGIYAFSRNPMYLSLWLILLSWFLWLGNGLAILGLFLFVFIMNQFQIKQEEQLLLRLFGKSYQQYCQRVRRWL
ncbi:isoprenylcysteine carboxylmethyltransferase family protein [Avibacterium sp. 21-586]|uniref:methyltransferase family protein n=1 Tax=Avibacterium sp. 21-586 TaxID=2911534 RepID=UPI0022474E33|nr:isoprenylcysteine carboxylmethyltransferase family protein [Avibacterium sp. 21-586]MCW9710028.1 isoprenylcysteine carboxylmethyltransferase family protein [Avibacterium sp. 21-586]